MTTYNFRIDIDLDNKTFTIREWGSSCGGGPEGHACGFQTAAEARANAMNNLPKNYELLFSHPAADSYRIEETTGKD